MHRVSERRACQVLGQPRTTQRYAVLARPDEDSLTAAIIRLASQHGRYGYRRITALLRVEGRHVNHERVERIWRREGLKVPATQPKRGRHWLNDGSCIRLRPSWPNHVWAYDFVQARTHDGRAFRILTMIDEFTRECLAIEVARRLRSDDVLHILADLMVRHGAPGHIRSDNGSEFTAKALIELWRRHYNTIRPHSALGYRPPAPQTTGQQRVDLSRALERLQTDRRFRHATRSLN